MLRKSLPGSTAVVLQPKCEAMPSARRTDRISWRCYCGR